ncbi:hypothetical protein RND81_13G086000 [Saponaria officinalis]|uniref:Uncharacterized protein n=1 Tax=Saponaria officinalis TaxID=3572 RepID=A0AAW1GV79_SAPOF
MLLSKEGREILIKAVAQSIPTYVMSVFKIPTTFCDELRKLISRYWWGHNQGERKIHWVTWQKLCTSKTYGGLGFRDYEMFNWALLGKQAWRLCTRRDSLVAKVIKGKYFPNSSFLEANLGYNPSFTRRSIREAKWVFEKGLRRRIGDGASTSIWKDPWLAEMCTGKVLSPKPSDCELTLVKDLLSVNGRAWDEDKVRKCLLPFEAENVLSIRLSSRRPRMTGFGN